MYDGKAMRQRACRGYLSITLACVFGGKAFVLCFQLDQDQPRITFESHLNEAALSDFIAFILDMGERPKSSFCFVCSEPNSLSWQAFEAREKESTKARNLRSKLQKGSAPTPFSDFRRSDVHLLTKEDGHGRHLSRAKLKKKKKKKKNKKKKKTKKKTAQHIQVLASQGFCFRGHTGENLGEDSQRLGRRRGKPYGFLCFFWGGDRLTEEPGAQPLPGLYCMVSSYEVRAPWRPWRSQNEAPAVPRFGVKFIQTLDASKSIRDFFVLCHPVVPHFVRFLGKGFPENSTSKKVAPFFPVATEHLRFDWFSLLGPHCIVSRLWWQTGWSQCQATLS